MRKVRKDKLAKVFKCSPCKSVRLCRMRNGRMATMSEPSWLSPQCRSSGRPPSLPTPSWCCALPHPLPRPRRRHHHCRRHS